MPWFDEDVKLVGDTWVPKVAEELVEIDNIDALPIKASYYEGNLSWTCPLCSHKNHDSVGFPSGFDEVVQEEVTCDGCQTILEFMVDGEWVFEDSTIEIVSGRRLGGKSSVYKDPNQLDMFTEK